MIWSSVHFVIIPGHFGAFVMSLKGVPNGMKGLSQKNGKSYKLLLVYTCSMAGMIETSTASHMILKVLLNGISSVNRI